MRLILEILRHVSQRYHSILLPVSWYALITFRNIKSITGAVKHSIITNYVVLIWYFHTFTNCLFSVYTQLSINLPSSQRVAVSISMTTRRSLQTNISYTIGTISCNMSNMKEIIHYMGLWDIHVRRNVFKHHHHPTKLSKSWRISLIQLCLVISICCIWTVLT